MSGGNDEINLSKMIPALTEKNYIDKLKDNKETYVKQVTIAKIPGTKNNLNSYLDIEVFAINNEKAVNLIKKIVENEQKIYAQSIAEQKTSFAKEAIKEKK